MKSWILIPDISGFTEFVHETAISHSGHIIQELLQILTESTILDMELIEIEGDALFFLGLGPKPNLDQLEHQIETMFLRFHEHLLLYDHRRVCPCGACRTAHKLSLKFVAHAGEVEYIKVAGHIKPHGSAVITAHRLLKNTINSSEYSLLSDALVKNKSANYHSGFDQYDVGIVHYQFKDLQYLKKNQKVPEIRKLQYLQDPDIKLTRTYHTDLQTLTDLVLDLSQRQLFNKEINELQYDENIINQAGVDHICIINGQRLNIETITRDHADGEVVFGERTTDVPGIDRLTSFWIITALNNLEHQLDMEIYFDQKAWWKKAITPILKYKFKKSLNKSLDNLTRLVQSKMN